MEYENKDVCAYQDFVNSSHLEYGRVSRSADDKRKSIRRTPTYDLLRNDPRLKSILVPLEAWTTLLTEAVPVSEKPIKEHHGTHPCGGGECSEEEARVS